MRASAVRSAAVLMVVGAVTGLLVALGLHWWAVRDAPTEFGFYAYSPLPNAVNGRVGTSTDWWGLLWPAGVAGLALGVLVAIVIALLGRRLTLARTR